MHGTIRHRCYPCKDNFWNKLSERHAEAMCNNVNIYIIIIQNANHCWCASNNHNNDKIYVFMFNHVNVGVARRIPSDLNTDGATSTKTYRPDEMTLCFIFPLKLSRRIDISPCCTDNATHDIAVNPLQLQWAWCHFDILPVHGVVEYDKVHVWADRIDKHWHWMKFRIFKVHFRTSKQSETAMASIQQLLPTATSTCFASTCVRCSKWTNNDNSHIDLMWVNTIMQFSCPQNNSYL